MGRSEAEEVGMNLGFRLFPISASTMASKVDLLTLCLLILCLLVLAGVCFLMLYSIIRFRVGSKVRRREHEPETIMPEIIWSAVPLCLFMGLFVWGSWLYYQMHEVPANASDIYVVGKQWMWKFEHPNGVRELNELHVPVGEPIRLVMTSQDVIHSFFVPEFRMKQDVLPGRYTYTWFQATRPGVYHLFCTQYCGLDHARMGGSVTVLSKEDYEQWLSTGLAHATLAGGDKISRGHEIYKTVGCIACHGENSPIRAPRLIGIYGTTIQLRNGDSTVVDENYLHEKLIDPYAKDVARETKDYEAIMPSFAHLPPEDLMSLVAYLKAGAPGSDHGP
jgi:cytochrome c oxidase subunit 2